MNEHFEEENLASGETTSRGSRGSLPAAGKALGTTAPLDATTPLDSANLTSDTDYTADHSADLKNPERGLYRQPGNITTSDTLVEGWLWLHPACKEKMEWHGPDDPRSHQVLRKYAAELQEWRKKGVKVIFRPRYDVKDTNSKEGTKLDSGLTVFHAADLEIQLNHIDAVAKMLLDNQDAIGAIQAGYFGMWGEWHSEAHGFTPANAPLLYDESVRRIVLDHILLAYGSNTSNGLQQPVELRKPVFAWELLKRNASANIGLHNDCFMTDPPSFVIDPLTGAPDDMGTYSNFPGSLENIEKNPNEDKEQYVERLHREWLQRAQQIISTKSFGGETCNLAEEHPNFNNERWRDCEKMRTEPKALHMNYLNRDYATGAAKLWTDNGCYEEVASSLGYRFEVQKVEYTKTVMAGQDVTVIVDIKNTGWAHLHNPRRAQLFLRKKSPTWTAPDAFDALNDTGATAKWAPGGEPTRVMFSKLAPAAGIYTVHLAIFDPAATVRWNQPEPSEKWTYAYAVRLASKRDDKNIFNAGTDDDYTGATGMNDLGIEITVQ